MIPILYEQGEKSYLSNGLGRLSDCISCTVTEERNGPYEVEFQYPITGAHYAEITEGRQILVSHDETGDKQPFIIYRRSAPIDGVVTFNAHHVTYDLSSTIVLPFEASNVASAFSAFQTSAMNANPFDFWTDNVTAGTMRTITPASVRSLLGGVDGSVLDVFGGEYEWDRYTVKNHAARGNDNGVTIRYGKNLTDIVHTVDQETLYNAIVPYWLGSDGECIYGGIVKGEEGIPQSSYWTDENEVRLTDENGADLTFNYTTDKVTVVDFSEKYEEAPTPAQLEADAAAYLAANTPWVPSVNIKVDFVSLWQTEEYKDIASLERVGLCDTVTVIYEALGVEATAKVIETKWNVLTEKYDEIILGDAKSNFADAITEETDKKIEALPTVSMMQEAIAYATSLIMGGYGGNVVINTQNGRPYEILLMDTDDTATAVNVWRWNLHGFAHSHTGYNGPFDDFAITQDGKINANAITTGTLSASLIKGGILKLGGFGNGNGVLQVLDAYGNVIGKWDNAGAQITGDLAMQKTIRNVVMASAFAEIMYYEARGIATKVPGLQIIAGNGRFDFVPRFSNAYSQSIDRGSVFQQYADVGTVTYRRVIGGGGGLQYAGTVLTDTLDSDCLSSLLQKCKPYYDGSDGILETAVSHFGTQRCKAENERMSFELGGTSSWSDAIEASAKDPNGTADFEAGSQRLICTGKDTNGNTVYSFNVTSSGGTINNHSIAYDSTSSKRYKHGIKPISNKGLDPARLLDLPVKQYRYNDGLPLQYADMEGQTLPGFIAEDVAEIYPAAAIRNADGEVESWDERRIVPGMLALIQNQQKRIDELAAKLARLEALINADP